MKQKSPRFAPAGVNQPVIDLLDSLQTHLNQPVRRSNYVHRIRVDIKRLRAWIRLIRDEGDAIGLRSIDRDLRDIMKKLSGRRDQQALRETLKWLEKKADEDVRQSSLHALHSHLAAGDGRIFVDWMTIKATLTGVLEALKQHTLKYDSIHMVREGLQRTYKRAAKSGDKAFSGKINPGDVHEFRKWTKYLFYQLEIIQSAYPELYNDALEHLEDLGNRLGRYHDLVLLKERLARTPAKKRISDAVKNMDARLDERMHKLLRRAHRLYRRVFSASSSRFVMDLP